MSLAPESVKAGDHVFLVDGSSFVFRAYFQSIRQDAKYNYRSDGLPTGAVRLFCTKLFQFVREGAAGIKPTHLAIIFDKSENSFRKEIYPPYKGNRSEPPEDLIPQFPLMRAAVRAFGLLPVEQDRYEADDLIATYARQARERGADVLIISADKDLMQLIGPGVAMYDPASGEAGAKGSREERRIGVEEVVAYFGVPPEKVIDVQALAGDSTDNVPGARGIGLKTAAQLINEYGDLDTLLARAGEIKQPKRREILTDPESVALIKTSKQLVSLVCDVPVETPLDDLGLAPPEGKALVAFFKALEFSTITKRAAEAYGIERQHDRSRPRFRRPRRLARTQRRRPARAGRASSAAAPAEGVTPQPQGPARNARYGEQAPQKTIATGPGELAAARAADRPRGKFRRQKLRDHLESRTARRHYRRGARGGRRRGRHRDLLARSDAGRSRRRFALRRAGTRRAIFRCATRAKARAIFSAATSFCPANCRPSEVLARLKPLLEAPDVLKIAHNMKFDRLVFAQRGIELEPVEDTLLLSYVLDAGRTDHGMDVLSEKYFGHKPIQFGEVAGSGRTFIGFARVPIDKATEYSAEDADVTLRLWRVLKPRLSAEHMSAVYETLERPMIEALARMEARGVSIDRAILSRLSGEFAQDMARLEAEIFELAGESFNLGSPKQLGDILFGKMGLAGARKTATGAWSTAAGVLDDLAEQGNELARAHSRLAAALEAEIDLYRRPARLRQSRDGARAHLLRAGGDDDRAALVVRAQSAEHSGAQRGGAQDPPRLHRGAGT